jgi:phosphoribosylformimino-5-aminoimidazole carboxamide ribotide isomerase
MNVIPAIDLRAGQVVRLIQGQYDRQITYGDNPAEQAKQFHADGARWLHVVDLDGAKAGKPVNTETIAAIVALGLLQVEVGGGIRDEASIRRLLEMGVTRVIIGTKAVSDFEWFSEMARRFQGQIVLGLDARDSMVATHGWLQDSKQTVLDFAAQADKLPLAALIYTDIAKDGMLSGPNIERTKALVEAVHTPVIASGGVKEIADIRRLAPIGVAGVIAGRSLYEGTLNLREAIAVAQGGACPTDI